MSEPIPLKMSDGIKIRVSDCDIDDDWLFCRTSVVVEHPSGKSVRWSLPNRLLARKDCVEIILDEILAELEERVKHA